MLMFHRAGRDIAPQPERHANKFQSCWLEKQPGMVASNPLQLARTIHSASYDGMLGMQVLGTSSPEPFWQESVDSAWVAPYI